MSRAKVAPRFPMGAPALVTPTRLAALSVCRLTVDVPGGEEVGLTMPAEDAHVVLYQLRDHPKHEFRLSGKTCKIAPLRRGTLNVVDLRGEPCGWLRAPADTLMFHLPRAALDEISEDARATKVDCLTSPESWQTVDPVVDVLHEPLITALATMEPANRLFHDHILLGLGAHFAATYGGIRLQRLTAGGLAPWQQRHAEARLASDLAGDLSLHALAGECGLSAAYFARAFKRSTGMTPHGWLQRRRIETAKRLLAMRELPLAEVALSCGFADQSHFTRTFARHAGLTPSAWQRLR